MSQFQEYLINKHEIDEDLIDKANVLKLAKNVPQSYILSNKQKDVWIHSENMDGEEHIDDLHHEKRCAHQLYKKYIREGCELEINIHGGDRRKIRNVLADYLQLLNGDINANGLFKVFIGCKNEVYKLMKFSLARYKKLKDFEQIGQALNGNKSGGTVQSLMEIMKI